ncbi:aldehyde oxidase-like isoform X2 [Rhinatrema bivittatum]|uniref:aldehyde oxidase-like isoform X2 n=1 Tax=Rhinatrema bivittatum TaxID=194408 RepID=UPI00112E1122|nr:aldehyde oxidase-like isoform X2 [Rhinatrema bivittatum]
MTASRGSVELIFFVNGKKIIEKNADPEETLLSYLRKKLRLTGTKYGCGGGGCGACTVMVSTLEPVSKKILHYTANACLLPICSLYGAAVTTVEGIGSTKTRIHPVQERIAKAHGSQCGFCTPGMVMSTYTLLRNHPEPTMHQISEALSGNLCRCTGYRPIIDGCKTFCKKSDFCQVQENGVCCLDQKESEPSFSGNSTDICTTLFKEEEFLPLDPTQEFIFPPELMLMDEDQRSRTLMFQGERITWISPASLKELLELKVKYPKAPLVMGNTIVGPEMKFRGIFHPVIISLSRVLDLSVVSYTEEGVTVGAGCSLTLVKDTLTKAVSKLPEEKTKIFQALLQQLKTLAGQQIRNTASIGGNIISRSTTSDLNPILVVGNCTLNLASKGTRQIPLNETFFDGLGQSALKSDEILLSVQIPYSRKWEYVYAFRQAQRRTNALPIVNSGMRVLFKEGTDIIQDISISFGGVGPTTLCMKKTCQGLKGWHWSEEMLNEACRQILDEVLLPGSAPGGMVEYRKTLTISFFFKFYLEVLQQLKQENLSHNKISVQDMSALEEFQENAPQTVQMYQDVAPDQLSQDPIGRPIIHQSGVKHATGEAVYCDDMPVIDGELFLAFITSTKPHAKIISIDVSDALKLPGVVDIITALDVTGTSEFFSDSEAEPLFAGDKVLCVGQIICALVADSPAHAKQGAAQVKIGYEELEPVILTIQDSIKHSSFFQAKRELEQGNVDDAFKTVDQIVEGEIYIGGQEHFYMETQSIRVVPKGEDNEMDVYLSSQYPKHAQDLIAAVLNVPNNRIFCHVKRVGGAFGGKITKTALLAAITAVAANKTGCAVRCVLERGDDMLITGGRHPFLGKYKVGFMNDGRIMAADVTFYNNGGYCLDDSVLVMEVSLINMDNAYKIPNLRCRGLACKTNLPSNTAFRGYGFPQAALITETWVEAVATKCGLPTEKVRVINMHKDISQTHYKQEFDAKNLTKCWNECMEKSSYYSRRTAIEDFNKQNYWKKKGIAMIPMKYPIGIYPKYCGQTSALVHIYTDGSVLVTHGGVEMGQGVHTKIMQVASRELKIPLSYIHLCETSTMTVPNTSVSGASVGTDSNGIAVKNACQTLRRRLEPIISKNPEGKWENWVKEAFLQSISLSATGTFRGFDLEMNWEKKEGLAACYFVYGVACSEVVIDCLTGDHRNVRTDIVMDIGCSINPAIDIGQIEGAFVQGLGLFTMEELKFSPQGVLYTRGPGQYKIPAACDIPEQFHVSLLASSPNPYAIYSSKGVGEPALFLGCSVYFAIKDALTAARKERGLSEAFTANSPLTPERIRLACGDHLTGMIPRDDPESYIPWAINV